MKPDPVTAAFAASLRRLRAKQGIRKAEVASLADVDPGIITRIENGTSGTTLATAGRIAAALEADLRDMITPVTTEAARG